MEYVIIMECIVCLFVNLDMDMVLDMFHINKYNFSHFYCLNLNFCWALFSYTLEIE